MQGILGLDHQIRVEDSQQFKTLEAIVSLDEHEIDNVDLHGFIWD